MRGSVSGCHEQLPVAFATLILATVGLASPAMAQGCVAGQEARAMLEKGEAIPFPRRCSVPATRATSSPGAHNSAQPAGATSIASRSSSRAVESVTIPAN
jgi:hypothetical protein